MSIDPAFIRAHRERSIPGRDFLAPLTALRDHGTLEHQVRARRGPHRRPDEPLQHDVRPVLHGRQPGRLRPRARVGRGAEDPRRLAHDQAAAPDERAVLGRRADALAALPPRHRVRARRSGTSASSARPTASASRRSRELRARRRRTRGCASRTCSSTASTNEANSHRKVGNLFDVKLRAIENLHAAGIDVVLVVTVVNGVNNDQVGADPRLRHRQRRQDHRRQLPARELHRPRRGHRRRDARAAALHALATSPTT